MDWGYVSTGVVGLAGIFGTLWQGKRSREAQTANLTVSLDAATQNLRLGIEADAQQARMAEIRRIYAAFHASVESVLRAEIDVGKAAGHEAQMQLELDKAEDHMYLVYSDLRLIAPASVRTPAFNVVVHFNDYVYGQTEWMEEFTRLQYVSIDAMRDDLGEPPYTPED